MNTLRNGINISTTRYDKSTASSKVLFLGRGKLVFDFRKGKSRIKSLIRVLLYVKKRFQQTKQNAWENAYRYACSGCVAILHTLRRFWMKESSSLVLLKSFVFDAIMILKGNSCFKYVLNPSFYLH